MSSSDRVRALRHALRGRLNRPALSARERAAWERDGYLVLKRFFDDRAVDAVNDVLDDEWTHRRRPDNPLVIDALEGPGGERRLYFRDVPDDARTRPYKLNDLYLTRQEVRELVLDARLVRVLTELLGGAPAVCNSLNFEWGSQQEFHFDTYYMPGPCPGGLVVTSICLEHVHPDAGPVRYYPGSHAIPPYRFSHGGVRAVADEMDDARAFAMREVDDRALSAEPFLGRKGDVLIWHEQLYHGGGPIIDRAQTRRSLVTHYWRSDVLDVPSGWSLQLVYGDAGYLARPHQPVR